jgi:hypothetical protein
MILEQLASPERRHAWLRACRPRATKPAPARCSSADLGLALDELVSSAAKYGHGGGSERPTIFASRNAFSEAATPVKRF